MKRWERRVWWFISFGSMIGGTLLASVSFVGGVALVIVGFGIFVYGAVRMTVWEMKQTKKTEVCPYCQGKGRIPKESK